MDSASDDKSDAVNDEEERDLDALEDRSSATPTLDDHHLDANSVRLSSSSAPSTRLPEGLSLHQHLVDNDEDHVLGDVVSDGDLDEVGNAGGRVDAAADSSLSDAAAASGRASPASNLSLVSINSLNNDISSLSDLSSEQQGSDVEDGEIHAGEPKLKNGGHKSSPLEAGSKSGPKSRKKNVAHVRRPQKDSPHAKDHHDAGEERRRKKLPSKSDRRRQELPRYDVRNVILKKRHHLSKSPISRSWSRSRSPPSRSRSRNNSWRHSSRERGRRRHHSPSRSRSRSLQPKSTSRKRKRSKRRRSGSGSVAAASNPRQRRRHRSYSRSPSVILEEDRRFSKSRSGSASPSLHRQKKSCTLRKSGSKVSTSSRSHCPNQDSSSLSKKNKKKESKVVGSTKRRKVCLSPKRNAVSSSSKKAWKHSHENAAVGAKSGGKKSSKKRRLNVVGGTVFNEAAEDEDEDADLGSINTHVSLEVTGKEVYASGDKIMVSVNFRRPVEEVNKKPMCVIDVMSSPYRVIETSPKEVVEVLSDEDPDVMELQCESKDAEASCPPHSSIQTAAVPSGGSSDKSVSKKASTKSTPVVITLDAEAHKKSVSPCIPSKDSVDKCGPGPAHTDAMTSPNSLQPAAAASLVVDHGTNELVEILTFVGHKGPCTPPLNDATRIDLTRGPQTPSEPPDDSYDPCHPTESPDVSWEENGSSSETSKCGKEKTHTVGVATNSDAFTSLLTTATCYSSSSTCHTITTASATTATCSMSSNKSVAAFVLDDTKSAANCHTSGSTNHHNSSLSSSTGTSSSTSHNHHANNHDDSLDHDQSGGFAVDMDMDMDMDLDLDMDMDSPSSPHSSELSDIFEPPLSTPVTSKKQCKNKRPSSGPCAATRPSQTKGSRGGANKVVHMKMVDDKLRIIDDVPSSAVEMAVKEKFLKKVQRQERAVEEIKMVLKPFYNRKKIDKDVYKEILRKCVPKVCHSKNGDINPTKIQKLVTGYVKKYCYMKKRNHVARL